MYVDESQSPDCPHEHVDEQAADPATNTAAYKVCEDCGADLLARHDPEPDTRPVQSVDPWATTAQWDDGVPF
jgi:hypothetical protein